MRQECWIRQSLRIRISVMFCEETIEKKGWVGLEVMGLGKDDIKHYVG